LIASDGRLPAHNESIRALSDTAPGEAVELDLDALIRNRDQRRRAGGPKYFHGAAA
jgi:hypothetical protein